MTQQKKEKKNPSGLLGFCLVLEIMPLPKRIQNAIRLIRPKKLHRDCLGFSQTWGILQLAAVRIGWSSTRGDKGTHKCRKTRRFLSRWLSHRNLALASRTSLGRWSSSHPPATLHNSFSPRLLRKAPAAAHILLPDLSYSSLFLLLTLPANHFHAGSSFTRSGNSLHEVIQLQGLCCCCCC